MIKSLKVRLTLISILLGVSLIYITPNFMEVPSWWPSSKTINYGLDIQGGLHLVLQADIKSATEKKALGFSQSAKQVSKEKGFPVPQAEVLDGGKKIKLIYKSEQEAQRAEAFLTSPDGFGQNTIQLIEAGDKGKSRLYRFLDLLNFEKRAVGQAVEVIRNRIDEFGVTEPKISTQGKDRIVVQFPGVKDTERIKELINSTAHLEFLIVSDDIPSDKLIVMVSQAEKKGKYSLGKGSLNYKDYIKRLNKDLRKKLPKGYSILFEKIQGVERLENGKLPHLVQSIAQITGDFLESASVGYDTQRFNMPVVNFSLNAEGGRKFYELTSKNVKKRMAIVLDSVIKSTPVLQSALRNSGSISLGSGNLEQTRQEATLLETVLNVGALPVPLEQLEEKTVGPTLGSISIEKGKWAGILAFVMIFAFLLVYYKKLGVVANIALATNVVLILSILTSLGATLTLPGVAGIILTLGMAVDANVIIFERIKEELEKGAGLAVAVKDGFSYAFSAIFDANVTTAAVCVVLMYFGTGPIRGFAVTLLCGIITSMFTAIFVSRALVEVLIYKFNVKKLT